MIIAALLSAAIATATPSPADLFAEERAAAGGAAWDAIGEVVERGTFTGSGLQGPYVTYVDTKTGFIKNVATVAGAAQGQGVDARGAWSQQGGLVEPLDNPADAMSARTQAYVARNGWWHPQTDPATFESLGRKSDGGTSYDVVRVVPQGGYPVDVWLDASTHLLAKTAIADASNVVTTTAYSAYRPVGNVLYPFATTSGTGDPKYDQHTAVASVTFSATANVADVTRPPNRRTGSIANGTSTTVPFDLDDPLRGHIVIVGRINGSRPLHLIFDTGGSNVVTPEVAREIGLHGTGSVAAGGAGEQQVSVQLVQGATLQVGGATLREQQVGIFPLPASLIGMMGGYRIDGVVGYEVLKNFVVSIDYPGRRLTLTDPGAFAAPRGAAAVHFSSATVPIVEAAIDGVKGSFMVDTGNAFYNTVSQPFLDAHGLAQRTKSSVLVQSSGNLGGAIRPSLTRVDTFQIGPYRIDKPVFAVTNTAKGALAGSAFAGNIGEAILTRFDVALDYERSLIYLKPNANFDRPHVGTLDGMSVYKSESGTLLVAYVNPGSPAAKAGLAAGDRILSANGVAAAQLGVAGLPVMERHAHAIRIAFARDGKTMTATLLPREMVR